MKKAITDFLYYANHHRILISSENRKIGIQNTLIGWGLIALSTVLFQNSITKIPAHLNFFIQFLSGTIVLFCAALFKGINFLKVTENATTYTQKQKAHLFPKQRKELLIARGLLAVIGYMFYVWSRTSVGIVDNSAIFSADAIVYALLIYFFLKEKINRNQWIGIIIASIGVSYIFFFDFEFESLFQALSGSAAGVVSSICLAIIILMNTVVVQHEPPLRIAFYQCLIGLIISSILILFDIEISSKSNIIALPLHEVLYSIFAGVFYAIALIFFFNAFLYTEPLLISVTGYSLSIFVVFFDWIIFHGVISQNNIISFLLICFGGGLAIFSQYKNDKKEKSNRKIIMSIPIYQQTLKEKMKAIREDYRAGKLGQYEFMSQKHEFNKLLFEFSSEIKNTDIDKIEILPDSIIFTLHEPEIILACDGGCRSAPFEILNFGKYEPEESALVFKMINDGDIIFDIGAHIGWYSVNFAKRFPHSFVYAFEPVPYTFSFLKKNIELNKLKNIEIFNHALLEKDGPIAFYYFKGGSALSSLVNLINHDKTEKIECEAKRLDEICDSLNIKKIDFIKCDVEGSELLTLKGGLKTIKNNKPILYLELYEEWCKKFDYSANDVIYLLENIGYQCFSISSSHFLKRVFQITGDETNYNYFFLHEGKHKSIIESLVQK